MITEFKYAHKYEKEIMSHFNSILYPDSPRASTMLCPSLARASGRQGEYFFKCDNKLFLLLKYLLMAY